MKRTPKSFDASVKQAPKQQILLQEEEEEDSDVEHSGVSYPDSNYQLGTANDELVMKINRLQVSTTPPPPGVRDDITQQSGSQHSSDDNLGEAEMQAESRGSSLSQASTSKKKKKKSEDSGAALLATISQSNWQAEDECLFARSLDYGSLLTDIVAFHFARDDDRRQFTVFEIKVITVSQSWVVYRRYSDFVTLASKLGGHCPPNFPPKTPFGGNFAKDFLTKRQGSLSAWLKRALAIPGVMTLPVMREFLVSQANVAPKLMESDAEKKSSSSLSSRDEGRNQKGSASSEGPPSAQSTPKRGVTTINEGLQTPPPLVRAHSDGEVSTRTLKSSPHTQNLRKVNMGDFETLQVLGKGSFGKVVLVKKRTGKDANSLYAMKILHKENVVNKKQVEHTLTERSVLGKMNHPFIVKLHYAFRTEKKLHFVLDYCPGGELFHHLGQAGRFSEDQGRFYAAEMTLALGHLHSHGVVYRDLKPENILFEANGHLKLADFGLSKEGVESTQGSHSFCGTPEYLAPEILNRAGHGTAVDWWSLGALLYEMLTGLPPWFSSDRQKLFLGIRQAPLRFPPEVSQLARTILCDFLKREPAERLGSRGVEQVKQHPFFASIDWVALYELRLPAPFIPKINGATDTTNFDPQFTRMPLNSEVATSPMPPSGVAASPATMAAIQQQQALLQQQQQQMLKRMGVNVQAPVVDDALFCGFTYQEDSTHMMSPPSTPFSMCSPPPPLPVKRASPLRPGPNLYNARPSSIAASSSVTMVPPFNATSPPVTG